MAKKTKTKIDGWSHRMTRWLDQTRVIHATKTVEIDGTKFSVFACGAKGYQGGNYSTLEEAQQHGGGHPCGRCARIAGVI